MKTDWQALSKKLGVLKPDGSEFYQGSDSSFAMQDILGEEWISDTLNTFIEGTPGNELAIKTLRFLATPLAAQKAFEIFDKNKITSPKTARLAVWALSDLRTPESLQYLDKILDYPSFQNIAIGVFRNLVFDHIHWFEQDQLLQIANKFNPDFKDDLEPLLVTIQQHFEPLDWYTLLKRIYKRPILYGVQKVEDLLQMSFGYSIGLGYRQEIDLSFEDFSTNFTAFVVDDYNAPSHCNWSTAIRLYSSSDSESVALFFEELAKFKGGDANFDRIIYREANKKFCCENIENAITNDLASPLKIRYENEEVLENKYGTGKYFMLNVGAKNADVQISNCPWCGSKL